MYSCSNVPRSSKKRAKVPSSGRNSAYSLIQKYKEEFLKAKENLKEDKDNSLNAKSSNNITIKSSAGLSKIPRLIRGHKIPNEEINKKSSLEDIRISCIIEDSDLIDIESNEDDQMDSNICISLKNLIGSASSLSSEEISDSLEKNSACSTKSTDSLEKQNNDSMDNSPRKSSTSSLAKYLHKKLHRKKGNPLSKPNSLRNSKVTTLLSRPRSLSENNSGEKSEYEQEADPMRELEWQYKSSSERLTAMKKALYHQQANILDFYENLLSMRQEYVSRFGKELPIDEIRLINYTINIGEPNSQGDTTEVTNIDKQKIQQITNKLQSMPNTLIELCKEVCSKYCDMIEDVSGSKGGTSRTVILRKIQQYKRELKQLEETMENKLQKEECAIKDLLKELHLLIAYKDAKTTDTIRQEMETKFKENEEELRQALNNLQKEKDEIKKEVQDSSQKDKEILVLTDKLQELTSNLEKAETLIIQQNKKEQEISDETRTKESEQSEQYRANIEKLNITLRQVKGQLHSKELTLDSEIGKLEKTLEENKQKITDLKKDYELEEIRIKNMEEVILSKEEISQKKIEELSIYLEEAEQKLDSMRKLKDQTEQKYICLKAQSMSTELEMNEILAESKTELAKEEQALQKEIDVVRSSLKYAEDQINAQELEKSRLLDTIQNMCVEQKQTNKQLIEKEKMVANLSIQNKKLQTTVKLCQEELQKKSSLYENLQEQFSIMKNEIKLNNEIRDKKASQRKKTPDDLHCKDDSCQDTNHQPDIYAQCLKDENFAFIINSLIDTVNENKMLVVDENKSLKNDVKTISGQLQMLCYENEMKEIEINKLRNILVQKDKILKDRKAQLQMLEKDNRLLYERKYKLQEKIRNMERKFNSALQEAVKSSQRDKQHEFMTHAINLSQFDSFVQQNRFSSCFMEEPSAGSNRLIRSMSTPKCSIIFKKENKLNVVVTRFFENIKRELDNVFTSILNDLAESEQLFDF